MTQTPPTEIQDETEFITNDSTMTEILDYAFEQNASDVFLSVDTPIIIKVDGLQYEATSEPLTNDQIKEMIRQITSAAQRDEIEANREGDFATQTSKSRFRVNVFHQQNTIASVIRTVPNNIRSASELKLPQPLMNLTGRTKGLVLVTGPTGSGKSTTLAAFINEINSTRRCHILTLEDPIEFTHKRKKALINQRNKGTDFMEWSAGLTAAMRQAPDVILIGEMRDKETVAAAIEAAETGHLVLATLHTNGAAQTINRILNFFSDTERLQIASQLSTNLLAIMSQVLIPDIKGGRQMVYELLLKTPAIAANIKTAKIGDMMTAMETGSKYGMVIMDKALVDLVKKKIITEEEAVQRATDPANFYTYLGRDAPEGNIF